MAPSDDLGGPPESRKRQRLDSSGASKVPSPTASMQPILPFTKLLADGLVTIRVGKGENCQIIQAHKMLLVQRSAFFDAAINCGFRESFDNEIVFEDDDPLTFEFFLTWLYTSQLPRLRDYLDISIKQRDGIEYILLRLFGLSDRLLVPDLQAICYQELREVLGVEWIPSSDFVKLLYDVTTPMSQLRQYIIEVCTFEILDDSVPDFECEAWKGLLDDVEPFSQDVSKALIRSSTGRMERRAARTHPYNVNGFKQLRQKLALSSLAREAGKRQDGVPPEPPIDDLDGLINKIYENMAEVLWEENFPEESVPWPHAMPSERAMAGAGWYHFPQEDHPDTAVCINCKMEFHEWNADVKPFLLHQTQSPDCPFVKATEMGLRPPVFSSFAI